ncbi:MAG: hypothetical protein V4610_01085 [Pseudomonadota bacterium]|jgi:hypothetical protein
MTLRLPGVLPPSLRVVLATVGERLDQQCPIEPELASRLSEIHRLPPAMVVKAEREIAETAHLFHWRRTSPRIVRLFAPRPSDLQQLSDIDGLEYVFLFHRDGHIREAALRKITGALPSAFAFAAICWRLNDWVKPVRNVAAECAANTFSATSAPIVADAALALLTREYSWGRWGDEKVTFEQALRRIDVREELADAIVRRKTGPTATVLRFALRGDGFDEYLPKIAREALQPEVRALAAKTLIDESASWPNGWRWRWTDKSMGLRRREPTFARRNVSTGISRETLIADCAGDKAAVVRKVAVASLIRISLGSAQAQEIASSLANDPSRSVRERAQFILQKQSEEQT